MPRETRRARGKHDCMGKTSRSILGNQESQQLNKTRARLVEGECSGTTTTTLLRHWQVSSTDYLLHAITCWYPKDKDQKSSELICPWSFYYSQVIVTNVMPKSGMCCRLTLQNMIWYFPFFLVNVPRQQLFIWPSQAEHKALSHTHLPVQGLNVAMVKRKSIIVVSAKQGHSIKTLYVFLVQQVIAERLLVE